MLEKHIVYSAKFPTKNAQRAWFEKLLSRVSVIDIKGACVCSPRTIFDWRRAKFHPRYDCIKKLCYTYKIRLPRMQKISRNSHLKSAGKIGGQTTVKKYGGLKISEATRRDKWNVWWNTIGKYKHSLPDIPIQIKKPKKSCKLAEFVGIMMGDGTVSTYHIGITLNATDDKEYCNFVVQLINDLFEISPKIYKRKNKNAVVITVQRKLLAQYLHSLGLLVGNKIKQGLDITTWILKNHSYMRACIRGLVDTDGSVFQHTYISKKKTYAYKKLSFTSASHALLNSVHRILTENGIHSHISKTNVRIGARKDVVRYFTNIGSHNTKHLKRMCD